MAWTGRELVVWGGASGQGASLRLYADGAAVVELSSNAVHDPSGDRWLPLPGPPSGAAPPVPSAGPERALGRIDSRSRSATSHLYVLEPAKPEP